MPKVSVIAHQLPASPIRKLVPFAEEAKQKGIHIYHLNIGQPDIESPKQALQKLNDVKLPLVEYSHSAGMLSYRTKLVDYYKQHHIDLDVCNIIVTSGGSEAVLFSFFCCLNPGDEVIVPEPFYTNYNAFAKLAGVTLVPVRSNIEDGFALPPMEAFESHITPKSKAILICNPNNPTGYVYSMKELEILGELVKKHDLFLLSDEVYREFYYTEQEVASVMHLKGLEEHVVLLDSISKRYSACGTRIGMFITKNRALHDSAMKLAQARLSPPTYGQIFGEAACDTSQAYFDAVKAEYIQRRDVVVEAINKIDGCFCTSPQGAFYLIARLPIDDCEKFCEWLLTDFNYENQTVMLAAASGFYATQGLGKNEVRISYVLKIEDLKKAMICLEKAIQQYRETKMK